MWGFSSSIYFFCLYVFLLLLILTVYIILCLSMIVALWQWIQRLIMIVMKIPMWKTLHPSLRACLRYERLSSIGPRGAFLVWVIREPHLVVDSFKGIDNHRGFRVSIPIFISVYDPQTPFVEHLTLADLDRWSRSIGPRGAFLTRFDMKISLRVYFLYGVVAWQVN